ncbi:MAG: hypothetical protein NTV06_03430, partial [candidate division Zixibacteria bacterium]|nr:hypothetical protein [candidate division Zixibacteria bacterium]
MKLRNSLLGAVVLLVLLTSLLLSGCSSSSTESKSSGSALQVASLSANPPSVTIGNTSIIEAVVSDGTTPLANRIATFTVTPSGAGTFTPAVDTSGSDGIVASIFTPTQTGTVSIRATVSGTVSRTVALSITSTQPSGSGSIRLVATPTRLIADGESTSQITITARDYDSHLAPDSTIIILTAGEKFVDLDSNGYFTSGIDSIVFDAIPNGQWDPIGNIPSTAMVDGGLGRAVATYTAGLEAVTTYIRATCRTTGLVGYAETQIELTPNTSIASITLMANNIHLAVKATGGIETAQLYATGYDPNGNQVPEGLPISFIITNGPGGGEHLGTTGYGPYIATTNTRGMAYCPIASGTKSGTIRVRAYVDTILSNATPIMVHAGPPSEITIGSEELNVQYWGRINERVGITAIVSDIYHNPVGDSVVVYFTCDEGTILAHEARTTGEEGIATSTWISGYDAPGADGIVEVYAETNGDSLADTT